MVIKNISKGTFISKKEKICVNLASKAMGMMFSNPKPLIFIFRKEKIIPLHMLFVFYPIDILFLDENKKVVEIKEGLKPFTFYCPKNKAKYIIELPKNAVKNSKTSLRDKIQFTASS